MLNYSCLKIELKVNEESLPDYLIANCHLHNDIEEYGVFCETVLKDHKIIKLKHDVECICILPNDNIACVTEYYIELYDESFKFIKTVMVFNHQRPRLITNNIDKIYIFVRNRIIITDLQFKKLKEYSYGNDEKIEVNSMQIYNGYIYAALETGDYETENGVFLKLDTNLNLINETQLSNFMPISMAIVNDLVMFLDYEFTYFYYLNNFRLKLKYHNLGHMNIFISNEIFYSISNSNWTVECYDKNGIMFNEFCFADYIKQMPNDLVESQIYGCTYDIKKRVFYQAISNNKLLILKF